ncbi:hypothetical protein EJB05_08467 [Eragrostis curvula]|uniref:Uncharacterized protein n=1 Tax=Eragrostis curvula TaxID=38414 RepID=A0A5J9W449_9POAL|nr:hypothetical protein EJB05_08467 [Eragrostis curvula]
MVAWWRRKVVPRARRAWAAVSGRLIRGRKPGNGGILKLHDDVQSCGYKDVQVMFDMITSELEAASQAAQKPLPSPRKGAVLRPPSSWPGRSSSAIAAAQ